MVRYSFQSVKKAEQSIISILQRAAADRNKQATSNIFFLGIPSTELDSLWDNADEKVFSKPLPKTSAKRKTLPKTVSLHHDAYPTSKLIGRPHQKRSSKIHEEVCFEGVSNETKEVNQWIELAAGMISNRFQVSLREGGDDK